MTTTKHTHGPNFGHQNTETEIERHPHAVELRRIADELSRTAHANDLAGRYSRTDYAASRKADQRWSQFIHGGTCRCWSCKGN